MSLHAESDPALNGFWTGITDDLLAGIVASIERGQRAGHFAPPPPRPQDLAHVLLAMLWHTGYEFSTTPLTRADEGAWSTPMPSSSSARWASAVPREGFVRGSGA